MLTVHFATRIRGFFVHLLKNLQIDAHFSAPQKKLYEVNSKVTRLKNILGRSWILDILGYIQVLKCVDISADLYASSNRFLHTNKPYFIYIENPTGLFHYKLRRAKSIFGRKTLRKELNSPNLKGLVFMSKACANTFEVVCHPIPSNVHTEQIYPLIPINRIVTQNKIQEKCKLQKLKILFVSQGTFFRAKGGVEVLEAFDLLRANNLNVQLEVITKIQDLEIDIKQRLLSTEGIILKDFAFSYSELEKEYFANHILVSPTSMDSFSLTILEAMKSGLTIIASRMYAIPEMVEEGFNGFLCDPQFWFFNRENIPNPKIWNHRKRTVYSKSVSSKIIDFLNEHITILYNDRELLTTMSLNSFSRASNPPYSENYIAMQWNSFLKKISK